MERWLTALGVVVCVALPAQEDLGAFWQRGHVRELLAQGIGGVSLGEWQQAGVNCVMGVKPAEAHAAGLKTRTWFTLNLINPKLFGNDLEKVKAMAAMRADGTFLRPYDPLFPTVAENWSACVNNPLWREHSAGVFRKMGADGWDGCHIDYASHYEPCFCRHCDERWAAYATSHGLEPKPLRDLPADVRYRLSLQEFRIRCVMDFLALCRDSAQAVRPGFATDGTYHQDSGSTYQWAYGDHFDLMCIEGTTWGPFPPESQQILWLKLAHALSRRQVAMSVTYHLVTEAGERHHGRMAPDRARLALCEIMSQGAVNWLGLGGPKTGNLLREHAEMVKEVYRTAAALEPQLAGRQDLGDVGIVFSPRSFLVNGTSRRQLHAVGQALMRLHVPFIIHSDVGLTPARLKQCPATVLLDATALTSEAASALESYVADGGRLLVLGASPRFAADWQELPAVPELLRRPAGKSGLASRDLNGRVVWYVLGDADGGSRLGAAQNVVLKQTTPAPLAVEGESKALNASGAPDADYSLYVDITYQDGSNLWGQVATFKTGTHDWELSRCIIEPPKPVRSANVHVLFRGHAGTVWFRKVRFGVWDPARQQIVANRLGDGLAPRGGKAYSAAAGQDATLGTWGPYAEGFEVEEIAGEGPTMKLSAGGGQLDVAPMHQPDPALAEGAQRLLAPVLPARPMITVEGEGADRVFCDLSTYPGGALLQFINYAAELHPELPELEQQKGEHTLPAGELRVTFTPPGGKALVRLTLKVPGQADTALPVQGSAFVLPALGAYAAVVAELR